MAGSQIAVPVNGASDWSDFVTFTERIARGYMGISLTEYATANEPQIAAGSGLEVGGAFYQFTALESITGWSGIADETQAYIKVVPAGTSITAEFTDSVPTWDTSKQGWYDGNDRYIAELYRDDVSDYTQKRFLKMGDLGLADDTDGIVETAASKVVKCKVVELGVWNMAVNMQTRNLTTLVVAAGIPVGKIRDMVLSVQSDDGVEVIPQHITCMPVAAANSTHILHADASNYLHLLVAFDIAVRVVVARVFYSGSPSGYTNWNDAVMNRGWITVWYEADSEA